MKRYIWLTRQVMKRYKDRYNPDREIEEWDHNELLKISPDNILWMSQRAKGSSHRGYCTVLKIVSGEEILVVEDIPEIERRVNEFYEAREKDNKDKIVITKDDVVKNFIFKNMIQ